MTRTNREMVQIFLDLFTPTSICWITKLPSNLSYFPQIALHRRCTCSSLFFPPVQIESYGVLFLDINRNLGFQKGFFAVRVVFVVLGIPGEHCLKANPEISFIVHGKQVGTFIRNSSRNDNQLLPYLVTPAAVRSSHKADTKSQLEHPNNN